MDQQILTASGLTGGGLIVAYLVMKLGALLDAYIAHQKSKDEAFRKQNGLS